jgi:methylmalonyl-CoA mutase cobalamin-binding subunit
VEEAADRLVEGARRFKETAFRAFIDAGIDTDNPLELLLALRRIGAQGLEERFGPGAPDEGALRGRRPVLMADTMQELETSANACLSDLDHEAERCIRAKGFVACVATTDVHEYGKIVIERVLSGLDVALVDGGVSADPDDLALAAQTGGADFIALSTYNGIALTYLRALHREMERAGLDIPVFVGGRINQIPEGSNAGLPVDVSGELEDLGATVCADVRGMLDRLASMAEAE